MSDVNEAVIFGTDFAEFCRAMTKVIQEAPPDVKAQLREIRRNSFAAFGFDGAFERLNGKTVSQILAGYEPGKAQMIAAIEVDGIRVRLLDAPGNLRESQEPT